MPSYATKELEKAFLGEGSNRVVGKPTTKRISLIWTYERHPQNYEEKFHH